MSFCRIDNTCDLFCFLDQSQKYRIIVAHHRCLVSDDELDKLDVLDWKKYFYPIGLPCDGQSFVVSNIKEVLNKFYELKQMGYRVPDSVIESIENS